MNKTRVAGCLESGNLDVDRTLIAEAGRISGGVDLRDTGDSVFEDPLDAGLQRHHRKRTASAGSDHLDIHGVAFGSNQNQVTAIGLDGRADVVERLDKQVVVDRPLRWSAGRD